MSAICPQCPKRPWGQALQVALPRGAEVVRKAYAERPFSAIFAWCGVDDSLLTFIAPSRIRTELLEELRLSHLANVGGRLCLATNGADG